MDGPIEHKKGRARAAILVEFKTLVRRLRGIDKKDPILEAFPNIHYQLSDYSSCQANVQPEWNELAVLIYTALPVNAVALEAALEVEDSILRLQIASLVVNKLLHVIYRPAWGPGFVMHPNPKGRSSIPPPDHHGPTECHD